MEKLSDREIAKIKDEFEEEKGDIKIALTSAKEVKSKSYNIRDEEVSKSHEILLPNGKRFPAYPNRRLRIDINLYYQGKNLQVRAGTKWEEIPMDVKLKYPFQPSNFE